MSDHALRALKPGTRFRHEGTLYRADQRGVGLVAVIRSPDLEVVLLEEDLRVTIAEDDAPAPQPEVNAELLAACKDALELLGNDRRRRAHATATAMTLLRDAIARIETAQKGATT